MASNNPLSPSTALEDLGHKTGPHCVTWHAAPSTVLEDLGHKTGPHCVTWHAAPSTVLEDLGHKTGPHCVTWHAVRSFVGTESFLVHLYSRVFKCTRAQGKMVVATEIQFWQSENEKHILSGYIGNFAFYIVV